MKRPTSTLPAWTYAEIVRYANDRHARRIAELKRAEKYICAIESDLTRLAEARVAFSVTDYSMHLHSVSPFGERTKWALHIDGGIFSSSEDRLIQGFIDLGWLVEAIDVRPAGGSAVLRKPKTHVRVHIYGHDPEYLRSIAPQEGA